MINNFFINRNQINLNLNKFFKTIFFKKQYIVKLNNKILKKKYKILHLQLLKISQTQELSEISYILNFSFSKKNLILHIMDYSGNTKFFSSANLLNLKGKQNSFKLNITFRKFYKVLVSSDLLFLKYTPIAIHLKNKNDSKRAWIIKKLCQKFFIVVIKFFICYPFNGCRIKKPKRKKFRTKKHYNYYTK